MSRRPGRKVVLIARYIASDSAEIIVFFAGVALATALLSCVLPSGLAFGISLLAVCGCVGYVKASGSARTAVAIALACCEAVADLVAARVGTRTIRSHARRLTDLAIRTYGIARYGRPAETAAVEPFVYEIEILEDR